MICKKCGKTVADSDLFCTNCGTVLFSFEPEKNAPRPAASPEKPAPVIVLSGKSDSPVQKPRPAAPSKPAVKSSSDNEFVWNVYDFPKPQSQKTEEINFSWNQEVETPAAPEIPKEELKTPRIFNPNSDTFPNLKLFENVDGVLQPVAGTKAFPEVEDTEPAAPIVFPAPAAPFEFPETSAPQFDPFTIPSSEDIDPENEELFRELFGNDHLIDELPEAEASPEVSEEAVVPEPEAPAAEPEYQAFAAAPDIMFTAIPRPEPEVQPEPVSDSFGEPESPSEFDFVLSDLEKDIFAELTLPPGVEISEKSPEKFFTFTQKNEEFQKLLDREYERMQNLADNREVLGPQETRRYPARAFQGVKEAAPERAFPDEEIAPVMVAQKAAEPVAFAAAPDIMFMAMPRTAPAEPVPQSAAAEPVPEPTPEPAVPAEPISELTPVPEPVQTPAPAVTPTPAPVVETVAPIPAAPRPESMKSAFSRNPSPALSPEDAKTILLETAEERAKASMWNEKPRKKTYDEEDDEDERPRRSVGGIIGKTILIIIIVFLLLEVASLAILFFAPDSKAVPMAEKFQEKTLGLVLDMKEHFE